VAGGERRSWQEIVDRKLAELTEKRHRLSRFWSIIEGQTHGLR